MDIQNRRPAETGTAAVGTLAAGVQAAFGPWWSAAITFVVAWTPAAFTWLVSNGGLRGLWRKIVGTKQ